MRRIPDAAHFVFESTRSQSLRFINNGVAGARININPDQRSTPVVENAHSSR
jgi:hypothetical protein